MYQLDSNEVAYFDRNKNDDDHYYQPKGLFEDVMTKAQQQNTISNIVVAMSGIEGVKIDEIINLQLCHCFRVSPTLGAGAAKGLNVNIDEYIK